MLTEADKKTLNGQTVEQRDAAKWEATRDSLHEYTRERKGLPNPAITVDAIEVPHEDVITPRTMLQKTVITVVETPRDEDGYVIGELPREPSNVVSIVMARQLIGKRRTYKENSEKAA